jgi:hypothetical protein
MEPRDLVLSDVSFALQTPDGISSRYREPAVVMADGSIRSLGPEVSPADVRTMLTADGGEPPTPPAGREIQDGRDRPPKDK